MIPEPEIEAIKSQVDFLYLVKSYGFEPVKKGKDHFIKCPFHEDDKPSLSIDPNKNLYHCFGCGAKGNPIQFTQQIEGLSFIEAVEKLRSLPSYSLQSMQRIEAKQDISEEEKETLFQECWNHFREAFKESPEAKEYLHNTRGIPEYNGLEVGFCSADFAKNLSVAKKENLKKYGLLSEKGHPHFRDCLVFPLKDRFGKLTSFYGRKIRGEGTHYYLKNRKGLYYSYCNNKDSLILVESILDAITLVSQGFENVLSLYGVNGYTDEHKEIVKEYKKIYLCLDGDKQGLEAAHHLAHILRNEGKKVHVVEFKEDLDPNGFFYLAAKKENLKESKEWLIKELQTLEPKEKRMSLCENDNESLTATGERLEYQIQGLHSQNLDKLKVTLRVSLKEQNSSEYLFIDSVDLYSRRARNTFVEGLVDELGVSEGDTQAELKTLISLLEKKRLEEREDAKEEVLLSDLERDQAIQALKNPKLVENLLKDFEVSMIGEEKAKLVGYLGSISRLLEEPLGVLIVSRSGAGKTTLQDAICSFVPEESLEKYTRLTGQSLFYQDQEGLKHKVLAIEEEDGMQEAIYAIRTLQSSQRLTLVTTRNDPKSGKFKTEKYVVEGPVFILISTTNPEALDYETRNRFIILTIDESEEQTQRIMDARKQAYTLQGQLEAQDRSEVLKKCANMQRLLKPVKVINNYAPFLEYPFDRLQMRREFKKYMTLINSIALLHQHQREIKTFQKDGKIQEYIEVQLSDITLANQLVLEFFPNAIDGLAPHTRRLGIELSKFVESRGGDVKFTRKELRDFSGWSDWQIREGLKQLEELEYITRASGKNGSLITYEMLVDVNSDNRMKLLLTDENELEKLMSGRRKSA